MTIKLSLNIEEHRKAIERIRKIDAGVEANKESNKYLDKAEKSLEKLVELEKEFACDPYALNEFVGDD